jgi:hypothetical protein
LVKLAGLAAIGGNLKGESPAAITQQTDQRSIRFSNFQGRTVLQVTGSREGGREFHTRASEHGRQMIEKINLYENIQLPGRDDELPTAALASDR